VTMDRYYTSVDLAEDLLQNDKLTIVGTVNRNRVHIPDEMKQVVGRVDLSTKFAWSGTVMLLSYVPKAKKNVLLLSTEHDQPDISQRPDRKPEVILAYNEDKGGVDVVDKMIDTYRCKVGTRRWPMVVFYTMIDVAALNTLVLWLFKNPGWSVKKRGQRRKHFLHELGMALVMPQIERRQTLTGLQSDIRSAIDTILDRPSALPPPSAAAASVAKCTTCIRESYGKGYKKAKYSANKVKQRCIKCQRPTCKKHSTTSVVCESCTG
jgi:hypothetical protein